MCFWVKNWFFLIFSILSQHFCILKNIEIEWNGLKLNEIAWIYSKQFWTHWYAIWYPIFKNDLRGGAQSWPSLEFLIQFPLKVPSFNKTPMELDTNLKFCMNNKDHKIDNIYENQGHSFNLTFFLKSHLFIDLIILPTLKLYNFRLDCYFLIIFSLKFLEN